MLAAMILAAALAQAAPAAPPPAGTMPAPGDDLGVFFAAMDKNGDGSVSRPEFDGWFGGATSSATVTGGADALKELGTYFTMMDANRDGRVTRPEFMAFHAQVDRSGEGE